MHGLGITDRSPGGAPIARSHRQYVRGAVVSMGLMIAVAVAVVPAVATSHIPAHEATHDRKEVLLRIPGGDGVSAIRVGASGPVAIRRGVLEDDPSITSLGSAKVDWQLPAGDAVYLDGHWWSPIGSPGTAVREAPDPATRRAIRTTIAPADDGLGRHRLYRASLGDVVPNGEADLVVSFRRPFRRTFINATRPARAWRDRAGMSAHLGIYEPATLRPMWVAGTLVHPVIDLAVCDASLAVAYGRLDRRGVAETGAWRWQGFGFLVSETLPGGGDPACVDVDGDGRLEPAILGRDGS
jgi:hypothetical protein